MNSKPTIVDAKIAIQLMRKTPVTPKVSDIYRVVLMTTNSIEFTRVKINMFDFRFRRKFYVLVRNLVSGKSFRLRSKLHFVFCI